MQLTTTNGYTNDLLRANELDPLDLGAVMAEELPVINQGHDLPALIGLTNNAVQAARSTNYEGRPRFADAALRDIDFLASSLTRMEVMPRELTGLEQTMSMLGIAAGTVPRGTVYTYALQNPNEQERTFTGSLEENFFIETVRDSGAIMLSQCAELLSLDPAVDEPVDIAEKLASVGDGMKLVVRGMVDVSRTVSPSFFTNKMRPFFDGIEIDGVTYAGAGGSQLPLVVVDRLMWGSESDSEVYQGYFLDNIRYQPADLRADLAKAELDSYQVSMLGHLRNRQTAGENVSVAVDEARNVMQQVKRFRMPHRVVAEKNFKLRPGGSVGSGQYTPSVLDTLIDLTDTVVAELSEMKPRERVSA